MEHPFGNHELSKMIDLSQYQIAYEEGHLQVRKNNQIKVVEAAKHFFSFFGLGVKHILEPNKIIRLKKEDFFHIGRTLWGDEQEFDQQFQTDDEKKLCTNALLASIKSASPKKIVSKETICKSVYEKTRLVKKIKEIRAHLNMTLLPIVKHISEKEKILFLKRQVNIFLITILGESEQNSFIQLIHQEISNEPVAEAQDTEIVLLSEILPHLTTREQKRNGMESLISLVHQNPTIKREPLLQNLISLILNPSHNDMDLIEIGLEGIKQIISDSSEKEQIKASIQKRARENPRSEPVQKKIQECLQSW